MGSEVLSLGLFILRTWDCGCWSPQNLAGFCVVFTQNRTPENTTSGWVELSSQPLFFILVECVSGRSRYRGTVAAVGKRSRSIVPTCGPRWPPMVFYRVVNRQNLVQRWLTEEWHICNAEMSVDRYLREQRKSNFKVQKFAFLALLIFVRDLDVREGYRCV
jgi:hypothetical protein